MAIPISAPPPFAPSRSRAFLLVAALFAFFFAAYAFTASGDIFSQGDTTIRVEIAENYLGRASPVLNGWKLVYPRHIKKEYLDPRVSTGRDGKTYSTYLPGQPLAIIPFDKLGQLAAIHLRWPYGPTVQWFARLVGPLFGALEVTLFFVFAARLGYSLRRALLLTAIFGFATSVWPDEQSVLEHTEVAFFLLLGFYFAFRYREQRAGWPYLLYSGAGLGGAAITRYQDAFLGLVAVAVYLLLPGGADDSGGQTGQRRRLLARIRSMVLVGLGLLPFAVVDLWYGWIRFGSPFATGHHETLFGYPMYKGIPGLLVSPGKGLIWYSPVILLLAIAGPRFYRRYPAFTLASAVVVAAFVLFYANITFWHGDPTWGPRYIYPTLPFLTLPLGELFGIRTRWSPAILAATVLVVLASCTIQFAAVSVSQWRTWYRVIAYEEQQGYKWQWIASRYRYFWNPHESPLNFQVHGLYQLAYDSLRNSKKYEIVPPDEDPILSRLPMDYAINQWNFWWTANEFNWWMGEQKIMLGVITLVSVMLASGVYITAEASGVFAREPAQSTLEPLPEAA